MLLKLLVNNCFCTTENVSFILFHLHFRFSCQAWLPEKETVGQRPLTLSLSASRTHSHMQPAAHILTYSHTHTPARAHTLIVAHTHTLFWLLSLFPPRRSLPFSFKAVSKPKFLKCVRRWVWVRVCASVSACKCVYVKGWVRVSACQWVQNCANVCECTSHQRQPSSPKCWLQYNFKSHFLNLLIEISSQKLDFYAFSASLLSRDSRPMAFLNAWLCGWQNLTCCSSQRRISVRSIKRNDELLLSKCKQQLTITFIRHSSISYLY